MSDEIKVNSENTPPRKNLATLGQVKDALNKRDEKINSLKEDLGELPQTLNMKLVKSKNLFDRKNIVEGGYTGDNGEFLTGIVSFRSDFINFNGADTLFCYVLNQNNGFTAQNMFRVSEYDSGKNHIKTSKNVMNVITDANTKYVIVSLANDLLNLDKVCLCNSEIKNRYGLYEYFEPHFEKEEPVGNIVCYGDSMTEGGTIGKTMPQIIQEYTGLITTNKGQSSQTSGFIAWRFGANDIYATFDGNRIPTSGSVSVTLYSENGDRSGGSNLFNWSSAYGIRCAVNGVNGIISKNLTGATFTRETDGEETSVMPMTKIFQRYHWSNNNDNNDQTNICIIWCGRNDIGQGSNATAKNIFANISAMIRKINTDRFIVLTVPNMADEIEAVGTERCNRIVELNSLIKKYYPNNYVDVRDAMVNRTHEIWNLSLSKTDKNLVSKGCPPTVLMGSDFLHPNETARLGYCKLIVDLMFYKGWI